MCIYKNNNNILKFTFWNQKWSTEILLGYLDFVLIVFSLLASLSDEPSMYQKTSAIWFICFAITSSVMDFGKHALDSFILLITSLYVIIQLLFGQKKVNLHAINRLLDIIIIYKEHSDTTCQNCMQNI